MSNSYFRVRIRQVSDTFEDIITTQAIELGASGVSEVLAFSQPDLTYDPDIVHTRTHDLDIFFAEKPSSEFYNFLKNLHPSIRWEEFQEENKDWLEEWKKGFNAFKLIGSFWVVPSWITPPPECQNPLFIDPGMAFGTGTHATTQIAAYFINHLKKDLIPQPAGQSLLDVGTGTGILAMLGRKLGFSYVTGLEIDPEARRTGRENVLRNKLDDIDISDKALEEIRTEFEVVVANIIDGVLIHLKKDLLRVTKKNGILILTGILKERDNFFFEQFIEDSELQVLRRIEKDEWVGYCVRKL